MWGLLVRAVRFELAMYRNLYLWARRRTVGLTPDAAAFSYAGANAMAVWGFIGVAVVELPLIHFVVPWDGVRITLLLLGLWTLVWMLGYAGGLRVYPHLATDEGLHVRFGAGLDVFVPWSNVASLRASTRNYLKGATVQVDAEGDHAALAVTILSQTTVEVRLREPMAVAHRKAAGVPIAEVRFVADDPASVVRAARERITAG